ncbi:MAG: hypothetical protein M1383_04685 [Patescibacteria group bacterium]|nr:hypothetical protein [Patescibacteria group bacterium]
MPQKKRFSLCRVRIEAPPPARRIEGRDPQKNVLFLLEEKIRRAQKEISGEHFSVGHASGASGGGADSFIQFPFEKGSRKVYNYSTKIELNGFFKAKMWDARRASH